MIIIPSFQRYENIQKHTLSYLARCGIKPDNITVIVSAHDQQLADYLTLPCKVLITDANRIGEVHNFITEYYDEGEFIVELDDDIRHIKNKDLENILNFEDLMSKAKQLLIDMTRRIAELIPFRIRCS